MALLKCPECGKEISDSAVKCPNCGVNPQKLWKQQQREEKNRKTMEQWNNMSPKEKKWGIIGLVIVVILAIVLIRWISNMDDPQCGACRGTGYYEKKTCPFCDGTGYSEYDPYD